MKKSIVDTPENIKIRLRQTGATGAVTGSIFVLRRIPNTPNLWGIVDIFNKRDKNRALDILAIELNNDRTPCR